MQRESAWWPEHSTTSEANLSRPVDRLDVIAAARSMLEETRKSARSGRDVRCAAPPLDLAGLPPNGASDSSWTIESNTRNPGFASLATLECPRSQIPEGQQISVPDPFGTDESQLCVQHRLRDLSARGRQIRVYDRSELLTTANPQYLAPTSVDENVVKFELDLPPSKRSAIVPRVSETGPSLRARC